MNDQSNLIKNFKYKEKESTNLEISIILMLTNISLENTSRKIPKSIHQ